MTLPGYDEFERQGHNTAYETAAHQHTCDYCHPELAAPGGTARQSPNHIAARWAPDRRRMVLVDGQPFSNVYEALCGDPGYAWVYPHHSDGNQHNLKVVCCWDRDGQAHPCIVRLEGKVEVHNRPPNLTWTAYRVPRDNAQVESLPGGPTP